MMKSLLRGLAALILVGSVVTLLSQCGRDQATDSPEIVDVVYGTFTYDEYNRLLATHVDTNGMVNYTALQTDRAVLNTFIASFASIDPTDYAAWSREQKLALWINAYNAITLQYIVDHYPIQKGGFVAALRYPANSIRQISGVWDKLTTRILGESYTLEQIEHDVLRAEFNEPRIHVAIVCASIGCPSLRNEAFSHEQLDEQLADQARILLSNPGKFSIDRQASKVHLSAIFDWFGKDFVETFGTDAGFVGHNAEQRAVLNFATGYLPDDDARYLRDEKYSVDYLKYDWSLNEQ